jgi:uncharacterized protein YuzE
LFREPRPCGRSSATGTRWTANAAVTSSFARRHILHLALSDGLEAASVELSSNITAELNANGELIGVEILEASRYRARISRSEDDDLFIVDVPELPGCSAHRATNRSND